MFSIRKALNLLTGKRETYKKNGGTKLGDREIFYQRGRVKRIRFSDGQEQFYNGEEQIEKVLLPSGQVQFYNKEGYVEKVLLPSGQVQFYNERKELHREDGPAIIHPSGKEEYFRDGERHREDGPAILCPAFLADEGIIFCAIFSAYYLDGNLVVEEDVKLRYRASRNKSAMK